MAVIIRGREGHHDILQRQRDRCGFVQLQWLCRSLQVKFLLKCVKQIQVLLQQARHEKSCPHGFSCLLSQALA